VYVGVVYVGVVYVGVVYVGVVYVGVVYHSFCKLPFINKVTFDGHPFGH